MHAISLLLEVAYTKKKEEMKKKFIKQGPEYIRGWLDAKGMRGCLRRMLTEDPEYEAAMAAVEELTTPRAAVSNFCTRHPQRPAEVS